MRSYQTYFSLLDTGNPYNFSLFCVKMAEKFTANARIQACRQHYVIMPTNRKTTHQIRCQQQMVYVFQQWERRWGELSSADTLIDF